MPSCNTCRRCLAPLPETETMNMVTSQGNGSNNDQKHTVATDALVTLGTCPIPDNSGRDAIHLAVEPAIASTALSAGEYISFDKGVAFRAMPSAAVGIVDPFIEKGFVHEGERFWLIVLPRKITSLRHVWSHPAFPEAVVTSEVTVTPFVPEQSMSMAWMKEFVRSLNEKELQEDDDAPLTYDKLMKAAEDWLDYGDYYYGPRDNQGQGWSGTPNLPVEFWTHYANITGRTVSARKKENFFSCSC